jgi:tRNA(His) 5'-end guanylyltransferase
MYNLKHDYESRQKIKLPRHIPVIIRLDGNVFHTLTKSRCEKPFDEYLSNSMIDTAIFLCSNVIQGAKCAYIQSDEISILVTDFDNPKTEAWFDYNVSKMESISSAKASVYFTWAFGLFEGNHPCFNGCFDSRARSYPKEKIRLYFICRQKDWIRNSISMLAQSLYSSEELKHKKKADLHEMIYKKGYNWANLHPKWKNGTFIYKVERNWIRDYNTIFTEHIGDRINRFLYPNI